MPKESVWGPSSLAIERGHGPSLRLDVAWGHDSQVEVGILKPVVTPAGEDRFGEWFDDGFWLDLDRSAVNRLIVLLRKARDQAYGPDA